MSKQHKNQDSPLISVIIPVYNCCEYIARCMDSVLAQTYKNMEVLLIDDGSTDGSDVICNQYPSVDSRVKVLHIPHSGVSAARNAGLEKAGGEYIAFVDADDHVSPSLLETLLEALLANDASIATCHHTKFFSAPRKSKSHSSYRSFVILPNEYNYSAKYSHSTVWGALYRRETIGDIRFFKEYKVGEDSVFFAQAVLNAKRIVDIDVPLYNYCVRTNSQSHKPYDRDSMTDVAAREKVIELFANNSKASLLSCYGNRTWIALRNYKKNSIDHGVDDPLNRELISYIRKDLSKTMRSSLPLKSKAPVLTAALAPKVFMSFYLKYIFRIDIE